MGWGTGKGGSSGGGTGSNDGGQGKHSGDKDPGTSAPNQDSQKSKPAPKRGK